MSSHLRVVPPPAQRRQAPPPPEPYVGTRELARTLGVSPRTIRRWIKEGLPSQTWGMGNIRRYRVSEAIEWAKRRESSKMSRSPRDYGAG